MGSDDRRMRVLEAIVREYVLTKEPVGSQALVDRYRLGVSSATVRNDMNLLEERGLITQPHTSAGRVPTDEGYRAIVDAIDSVRPLSSPERRAMEHLLDGAVDLDDVLARAARSLAALTHQVAIIQYPTLDRSAVRHIELVPVGERHVLLVLITTAGRVEQRHVTFTHAVNPDGLARLTRELNESADGKRGRAAAAAMMTVVDEAPEVSRPDVRALVDVLTDLLNDAREDRLTTSGTSSLSRQAADFSRSIEPVLDALEEQVVLLRLLALMDGSPSVSIGKETGRSELSETAVISSTYGAGDGAVARVGVVGPTRMNYRSNIAAVQAVARYLSRALGTE